MYKSIYCFWFGEQMSPDRKGCLTSMAKHAGVPVILVTEKNLKEYVLPNDPLHAGFEYLSATHKSDYLRSYFMYHYGGGYSDIKQCDHDWGPYFDQLEHSDKQFMGYSERSPEDVAYDPAKPNWSQLAGNGKYIFKQHNKFAQRWMKETNIKMDQVYHDLTQHPGHYHPRAIRGGVAGEPDLYQHSQYPLEWNELLGRIFHRLQLDYLDDFLLSLPYVNINNYR